MTSPRPAFQACTGSCHEKVPEPKGGIIQSAIDCIGPDRDSCHLGALSTILPHLLADVTLHWGMYPAGKVDIS